MRLSIDKLIYLFRDKLVKDLYDMSKSERPTSELIRKVYNELTLFADALVKEKL